MIDLQAHHTLLKGLLKESRYVHSVGVMNTAVELAEIYGANTEKAATAGLLHDITKNMTDEMQMSLLQKYGVPGIQELLPAKKIWHSVTGAYYVKNELGINDDEIFGAIRYHTTGRCGMTVLEKIIYVADFIEPSRSYAEADSLRRLARTDLDKAVYEGVKWCVLEKIKEDKYIHADTFSLYNDCVIKQGEK